MFSFYAVKSDGLTSRRSQCAVSLSVPLRRLDDFLARAWLSIANRFCITPRLEVDICHLHSLRLASQLPCGKWKVESKLSTPGEIGFTSSEKLFHRPDDVDGVSKLG